MDDFKSEFGSDVWYLTASMCVELCIKYGDSGQEWFAKFKDSVSNQIANGVYTEKFAEALQEVLDV